MPSAHGPSSASSRTGSGPIALPEPDGFLGGDHPDALDPDRFLPANRRRLTGPGLRTFVRICDLWDLTAEQRRRLLGLPARSTYRRWVHMALEHRDLTLSVDVLTRISAVLGIFQALGTLEADVAAGAAWLRRPHKATVFGGRSPLDLMMGGMQDDLLTVRRYLEAAQNGIYLPPNEIDRNFRRYTSANIVWHVSGNEPENGEEERHTASGACRRPDPA